MDRDRMVETMKTRLAEWSGQIRELERRSKLADAVSRVELHRRLGILRHWYSEIERQTEQVERQSDRQWLHARTRLHVDWETAARGVDRSLERVREIPGAPEGRTQDELN